MKHEQRDVSLFLMALGACMIMVGLFNFPDLKFIDYFMLVLGHILFYLGMFALILGGDDDKSETVVVGKKDNRKTSFHGDRTG